MCTINSVTKIIAPWLYYILLKNTSNRLFLSSQGSVHLFLPEILLCEFTQPFYFTVFPFFLTPVQRKNGREQLRLNCPADVFSQFSICNSECSFSNGKTSWMSLVNLLSKKIDTISLKLLDGLKIFDPLKSGFILQTVDPHFPICYAECSFLNGKTWMSLVNLLLKKIDTMSLDGLNIFGLSKSGPSPQKLIPIFLLVI